MHRPVTLPLRLELHADATSPPEPTRMPHEPDLGGMGRRQELQAGTLGSAFVFAAVQHWHSVAPTRRLQTPGARVTSRVAPF